MEHTHGDNMSEVPTDGEISRIIEAASEQGATKELVVRLLADTGMRLSTLLEIDESWLESGIIHIPEEDTKVEEGRSVPIQDEDTQEFVEAWFSVHSELDISRTTAYRYVKKAGEGAGLDKEVTPMALRRYVAEDLK